MVLKADEAKSLPTARFVIKHDLDRCDHAMYLAHRPQLLIVNVLAEVLEVHVGELLALVSQVGEAFLARDKAAYVTANVSRENSVC